MKNNLSKYIKKRFSPLFFVPITLVFYLSFYLYSETNNDDIALSITTLIGFLIVFLIFFHIRILDDIKDYKEEVYNKESLKKYLIAIIILEILLSTLLGANILAIYLILLLFSAGIFYDFFIRRFLTKNLLLKNFTHQTMIILIGVFIFLINHKNILKIDYYYILFCFNMFFIFALFEFTRKIKDKKEEESNKSYNNIFGKKNFSILIITMIALICFLTIISFEEINYFIILVFESIISLILIATTVLYLRNKIKEKVLKKACFLFLLLTLLMIIFTIIYTKDISFEIGTLAVF